MGCSENKNEKLVNHSPSARDLSFSRVLPASKVGYHAGKPIESVVYCFYKMTFKMAARFVDVSESEIHQFKENAVPQNNWYVCLHFFGSKCRQLLVTFAKYFQGCQLSRKIRETPDFELFLPVSRLESEISRIIAEV